jgi:predicted acylesterase/phospholipase RssA
LQHGRAVAKLESPMPSPERDLALTFAGGGNRSFYQLGLLRVLGDRLLPRVAAIAACSAGACVATMMLAGRTDEAHVFWKDRRKHVTRNFDWSRLLARESPAPHGPIYRDTLLHAFDGGGLARVRAQPFPILVQTTGFPRGLPASLAVALGIGAYSLEKALRKEMLHPELGRALGFRSHVFDARACETKEELAALVLASSATPPFTPLGRFRGHALLDGGIVDNAPAALADAAPDVKRNVVLLTRPYPPHVLGARGRRFYLAPTKPVPIERWDYTRPDLLDDTIAMGEREAAHFGPELDAFLAA